MSLCRMQSIYPQFAHLHAIQPDSEPSYRVISFARLAETISKPAASLQSAGAKRGLGAVAYFLRITSSLEVPPRGHRVGNTCTAALELVWRRRSLSTPSTQRAAPQLLEHRSHEAEVPLTILRSRAAVRAVQLAALEDVSTPKPGTKQAASRPDAHRKAGVSWMLLDLADQAAL